MSAVVDAPPPMQSYKIQIPKTVTLNKLAPYKDEVALSPDELANRAGGEPAATAAHPSFGGLTPRSPLQAAFRKKAARRGDARMRL